MLNFSVYLVWLIATFFAFFQFFLQSATGVIGAEWQQDFHLSKVELSNLSSAFYYTYALMQIPAGILFDRFQPRYIMACSAGVLTIGIFLLVWTDQYSVAFIARLLMGAGSAFGFIGMLQVCATNFPANRFAFMVGLSEGLAMSSVTFSIILLNWLVAHYSWRVALAGCGCITFLIMLATYTFIRHQNIKPHHESDTIASFSILKALKTIFTNRQVVIGSIYSFFMFAIVNAFTSLWGIAFLVNTNGLEKQQAANMVAMVFIGIAIGGPLNGWLSKVLEGARNILIACAALSTITMSLITFCSGLPSLVLFVLFFLAGAFCSAYIQCFAVIKDSVPADIRATSLAASNMIIMIGAPILQLIIGSLLQSHFFGLSDNTVAIYRLSLAILPAGMFLAFLLAFYIKDPELT
jgi:MFS family permease